MNQHDEINHPRHYELAPGLEAWDVIKATLTPAELRGYCVGQILKYRLRAGEKGDALKCIGKANWYRARLEELSAEEKRANDGKTRCEPYVTGGALSWDADPTDPDLLGKLSQAARESQARCRCRKCSPVTVFDMRMPICPKCGNKRCPHAANHENACTNSNEPGQPGSDY